MYFPFKNIHVWSGVAQWIERQPVNQNFAGSIPVRAHAWVAGQVPIGGVRETNDQCFSHVLKFLSLSFSLSKK